MPEGENGFIPQEAIATEALVDTTSYDVVPEDDAGGTPQQQETETAKETETRLLFKELLGKHQEHLAKFPADGKNYFIQPPLSEEMSTFYDELSPEQVADLIKLWINEDIETEFEEEFDPRTLGNLLRSLTTVKQDTVKGILRTATDVDANLQRNARILALRQATPHLDDDLPVLFQDKTYEFNETSNKLASLSLFRKGIVTQDLPEIFSRGQLFLRLSQARDIPAIKAIQDAPRMFGDPAENALIASVLIIEADIRAGQDPEDASLNRLLGFSEEFAKGYLSLLYADKGKDQVPAKVAQLLSSDFELTSDSLGFVDEIIIRDMSFDPESFYAEKLSQASVSVNLAASFLKTGIDTFKGDWSKVDKNIQAFIEKNLKGASLDEDAVITIFSTFLGNNTDFPPFITSLLQDEKNIGLLKQFSLDFDKHKTEDFYGDRNQYENLPLGFFISHGFEGLPPTMKEILTKEKSTFDNDFIARRILDKLLMNPSDSYFSRFFYPDSMTFEGKPTGSIDDYKGEYWKLVHKDLWDIVGKADMKVLGNFFKTYDYLQHTGVSLKYRTDADEYAETIKPLHEFVPPQLIEKFVNQIFPEGKVTKESLDNLTSFPFILTDEVIARFPESDHRLLRLARKAPNSARILFEADDRYEINDKGFFTSPKYIEDYAAMNEREEAHRLLTDEALASFSPQDRAFWLLWREASSYEKYTTYSDRHKYISQFTPEGLPTTGFFELAAKTEQFSSATMLLTPDVLNSFSPEDKAFWSNWKNFSPDLQKASFEIKDEFSTFIDSEGKLKTEFYEKALLSGATEGLLPLLTEEVVASFSQAEREFWKYWKSLPEESQKKFHKILGKNGVNSFYDYYKTSEGKIDEKKVEKMFVDYKLVAGIDFNTYLSGSPEKLTFLTNLEEVSRQDQWADVITDPQEFWTNNTDLFVYLTETGFTDFEFGNFRSITNNQEVVEMLRSQQLPLHAIREIKDQLGLTINDLSYLDLSSMTTIYESITNKPTVKFYKDLFRESPRSFRNAINSLRENRQLDITNPTIQADIKSAINQIGNITPAVLRSFVGEKDPYKRAEFVTKVRKIRQELLQNKPVKELFADLPSGDEVLNEYITLAFPGTSLSEVRSFMYDLEDRPQDLAEFKIRDEGYEATSTAKVKVAKLKEGQTVDRDTLKDLREMFPRQLDQDDKEALKKQLGPALTMVLKRAGAFTFDEVKTQLPTMLSILYDDESVRRFRKTNFDFSQDENVTTFLERTTELLGVYFKDNFEERLTEEIKENGELRQQLATLVNEKRLDQIVKNLAQAPHEDKVKLEWIVGHIKEAQASGQELTPELLSGILTLLVENRIMTGGKGLRKQIATELRKFEYKTLEGDSAAEDVKFKGFVSKNAASFFAKMSAGVCTARDTELFNRPDHFHVNLAKGDTIVGNIQGYKIEQDGKPALLFRGFNPSASFVNRTNVEVIGDGMMSIVKQFAKDNGMDHIFISEQLGDWHALTNRVGEGVIDYFKQRYLLPDNEIPFSFPITHAQTISKMYKVAV